MSAPNVLEVEGLCTSYFTARGEVRALQELGLDLKEGEILGLVGASGAGKSTLVASILRLVRRPGRIIAGAVRLRGQDLLELGEREMDAVRGRELGLIASNPHSLLNPLLPVGRQIAHAAQANLGLGKDAAARRAVEMLEAVGIPDPRRRAGSYPHELSGGMAQRVVISIGLVGSPRVLIADEPTFGLDVTIQAQVLELMRALVAERPQTALMLVTRDLGIVAHYCERLAVMHEGRLVETGRVGDVWRAPQHAFTQRLIEAARLHGPPARAAGGHGA